MTPADRERWRAKLLAQKAEILAEGDLEIEPVRKDATDTGGDEDLAPLTEMSQVIASKRNRARTESLARIMAALKRLDDAPDDFGLCRECGEPIGKRLEAMPYVELCLECQSEQDGQTPRGAGRRHLTDFK
ncbi:MAG TPA: TraR/DksA family transcriptional regulator [Polyangia bacterium]